MTLSPPPTGTWLYRLRWPLFLAAFGIYAFLHGRYETYRTKRAYAERVRDAQRYLEASNPARRRAGLWPITSGYYKWIYSDLDNSGDVRTVSLLGPKISYGPGVGHKSVAYDPNAQRLLWEYEEIFLHHPWPVRGQLSPLLLQRRYSYIDAARGRNPWTLKLGDTLGKFEPGDVLLTPAQADSVLRDWRALGVRDSLAAVKNSLHTKPTPHP